jgi:hypothetical protein
LINLITPPAELVAFVLEEMWYGAPMKRTVFFVVLGLLVLAAVVLLGNSSPNEPGQPIASSIASSTTLTASSSKLLTVEYLSSQPDWNPTTRVEGMYRVEDGISALSNPDVTPLERPLQDGLTLVYPDGRYDYSSAEEFGCRNYISNETKELIRDCVATPVEEMNEFIILDTDGKVLHKYSLEEGFSLARSKWSKFNDSDVTDFGLLTGHNNIFSIYIYIAGTSGMFANHLHALCMISILFLGT